MKNIFSFFLFTSTRFLSASCGVLIFKTSSCTWTFSSSDVYVRNSFNTRYLELVIVMFFSAMKTSIFVFWWKWTAQTPDQHSERWPWDMWERAVLFFFCFFCAWKRLARESPVSVWHLINRALIFISLDQICGRHAVIIPQRPQRPLTCPWSQRPPYLKYIKILTNKG